MGIFRAGYLAAVGVLFAGGASALASYTFMTIDDPSATGQFKSTRLSGISGNTVVGSYTNASGTHAFSETGGMYTTITGPLGNGATVNGIAGKTIVGTYADASNTLHVFTETGGVFATFTDPSARTGTSSGALGTYGNGLFGGTVVGQYDGSDGHVHGFIETGGNYMTLDDNLTVPQGGQTVKVIATSATGASGNTVVGVATESVGGSGGLNYGFSESNGVYTTLNIVAEGISGDTVAGFGFGTVNGMLTAVGGVETDGVYTTLVDPLSASGTWATGIDGTTVVGYYQDAAGVDHGFIATLDVPEAGTAGLLGVAFLGLLGRRRLSR